MSLYTEPVISWSFSRTSSWLNQFWVCATGQATCQVTAGALTVIVARKVAFESWLFRSTVDNQLTPTVCSLVVSLITFYGLLLEGKMKLCEIVVNIRDGPRKVRNIRRSNSSRRVRRRRRRGRKRRPSSRIYLLSCPCSQSPLPTGLMLTCRSTCTCGLSQL